ncbi:MAG TPA: SAM-dependent methyltransferase [Pyrinomonadaceae bacterium]|jgi:SAM-dependent MidA family methyltransferase
MHARQPKQEEQTNHLADRLRQRIRRSGPVTFHEWMTAALYDPVEGYYYRRDLTRWGRTGDYRTSPERSPLFAATFARYFARLYEELGAPARFTIVEGGAGAGHFAAGVLETLRRDYPKIFAATRYVIDEASNDATERARATLNPFTERVEFQSFTKKEAPLGEAIVFANELLDAFPVHRVTMRAGQLLELCVGCDAAGGFVWVECEPSTPRLVDYLQRLQVKLAEGQTAEINLEAVDWIARVASILQRGFLIMVDYGAEADELYNSNTRRSGTLRAFHQHQFADDVLAHPGQQDLTTTVDWTSIKNACAQSGLQTVLFERQDRFLLQAGLLEELERLSANASSEAVAASLRVSARHMILPDAMSASFQVLVQKAMTDKI